MNINPLFSSYVAQDDLDIDNAKLEKYCRKVREIDAGRQVSNQGGWQSELIFKIEEEMRELYEAIDARSNALNQALGFDNNRVRVQSFWININDKGNYNEVHDHPGSFYAGVYYVKSLESQGDLAFYNPITFFSNYVSGNKAKSFNQFNSVNWQFKPKTGRLYIFPSYLNHFVRRNMIDEDRVSIAFNCGIDIRRG